MSDARQGSLFEQAVGAPAPVPPSVAEVAADADAERIVHGCRERWPRAVRPRVDLWQAQASAMVGIEGWHWYGLDALPPDTVVVEGAVAVERYTKGPRKGEPKFYKGKLVPGTTRRVAISQAARDAFLAAWEAETGLCANCGGEGRNWTSIHVEHGVTFAACTRCHGSGERPTTDSDPRQP